MTYIRQTIAANSNLILRILQPENAPRLFQLVDESRERLGRWLPWVEHTKSEADSLTFIQQGLLDLEDDKAFHYGIWYDRQLVGVIGAHAWRADEKFLEIGYWIGKDFEGMGIMTQACRNLISEMFIGDKVRTIQMCCDPANDRSSAIPKRLLFDCIERSRKSDEEAGGEIDVYQITSGTWK
ncbi:MAG: GNAT family N-acetyltransferase [Patescibacteria group bacterium]